MRWRFVGHGRSGRVRGGMVSLFFFLWLFLFLRRGGGWFRREEKGRERLGHEMNRR